MRRAIVVGALALVACKHDRRGHDYDRAAATGVFAEVDLDAPPGLSDLAVDPAGTLWALPERDRVLVAVTVPTRLPIAGAKLPTTRVPLEGVPAHDDTESLTWLDADHVALGLEGQDRGTATLAIATRTGDRFVVGESRALETLPLGVTLADNHGAEGLCGSGDDVLVAIEETGKLPGGGRFAPVIWLSHVRAGLASAPATIVRVKLGSRTGKLSALSCTIDAAGAHVAAIERHYGVSRIVTFAIPRDAVRDQVVDETLVRDLAPILQDSLNLEGLATLPDGRVVAIADNQGKDVAGPDALLVFAPTIHLR